MIERAHEHLLQEGIVGGLSRRAKLTARWCQDLAGRLRAPFRAGWLFASVRLPRHARRWREKREPRRALRRYFDCEFYLRQYPDVKAAGLDPFAHYMEIGAREGRSPNPVFHVRGYSFDHADVAECDGNPLLHYLLVGRERGATPHPLFDSSWYARRYHDVRDSRMDPYEHYLNVGRHLPRAASAAVDDGMHLSSALRVPVPTGDETVTIIIPAYGNFAATYRSLAAVSLRTPPSLSLRVILADDCPEKPLRPLLGDIEGLEIIENPVRLGFLANCSQAARHARGDFIVFLSSDTAVQPGWLASLVEIARSNPRIGMVGCKLLNADGSIQEAGNVLFKDATGYAYGRGDAADRPEYGYVRAVDSVSAACLLVRRDAFEKIGRFNESSSPAFLNEYDLALALADSGYKVVYQPASRVYHYGSAAADASVRDLQAAQGRRKFISRWSDRLRSARDGPQDLFLARERPHAGGCILVIDEAVPRHDVHAGALTMFQYLQLMVKDDFKVIYLPHDRIPTEPYTSQLQQMGVEVLYGRFSVGRWFATNGRFLDWVLVARPNVAPRYIGLVRNRTRARLLYYTHDLHFLRELRRFETLREPQALRESRRLRGIETRIFQRVDCVLAPSTEEASIIQGMVPGCEVRVLPPYLCPDGELAVSPPLARRRGIIFVGGYDHLPNLDAALFLVTAVMPRVWECVPDAHVYLVGHNPPPDVHALAGARVTVAGHAPDLAHYYSKARMSVSALRYGAGVKGKILSSLAAGVPVVTTTVGNEGIRLVPDVEALIADAPLDIARKIVQLFEDPELLSALARAGRHVVGKRFSEQRGREALLAALLRSPPVVDHAAAQPGRH